MISAAPACVASTSVERSMCEDKFSLGQLRIFAKQLKSSGTKIALSKFDKNMWKNIDIVKVKEDVEKHFELLLSRQNLEINILHNGKEYNCKKYN